jgi:hypothetical protein
MTAAAASGVSPRPHKRRAISYPTSARRCSKSNRSSPTRPNHFAVLDQLDRPADRIPGGVALLKPLKRCVRFGQCPESRHVVVPGDLGVSEDAQERCRVPRERGAESEALGGQFGKTARPRGLELAAVHRREAVNPPTSASDQT